MDDIGLAFTITADPSSAEAALDAFGGRARSASDSVNQSFGGINKTMLSNRESVRLLSEEMGIHLPRAVSGAVAEMLPAISSIGPVLLGAFAVMEIPKLVKGISDLVDSWEGFGKAEKKAMADAIRDTASLAKEVKSVENELDLFGKSMAEKAAMQAKWAGEDADRALQDLLKAESKVADLNAKVKEAKRGAGVFAAGAGGEYAKAIEAATAEVNAAREAWKLADEKAFLEQKKSAEAAAAATVKAAKDEAHAAKEAALSFAEWAKQQHAVFGTGRIMQQQVAIEAMAHGWDNAAISVKLYDDEQARFIQELPLAQSHLVPFTASIKQVNYVLHENASAVKIAAAAMNTETAAQIAQAAIGLAGLVAGRKAAAAVEAVWETAQGIKCLAEGTWPPNPAAIAAAALHFEAAAEYAIVAGSGGGKGGGRSASGSSANTGGNQSSYGGSPGSGGGGPGGGGGGGRGPTIVMNNYGPLAGSYADLGKALTPVLNSLGASGQIRLTAYNALTNGAKQT